MEKLDIIYRCSLSQVQGVNFVNDSFVRGKNYFLDNGIKFLSIITYEEIFDCDKHNRLDTIHKDGNFCPQKKSSLSRRIAKTLLSSNLLIGSLLRSWKIMRHAKKAAHNYVTSGHNSDYLLFHGTYEAYYYYKLRGNGKSKSKVVVLNHSNGVLYDGQLRAELRGLFRYPFLVKIIFGNKDSFVYNNADKICFLSKKAADKADYIPIEKKAFIYNGVADLENIELKGDVGDVIEFVCVGSIKYWKGQDLILQSLTLLDDEIKKKVHINFVGSGEQEDELLTFVNNNNLDKYVRFWGVRNDVSDILKGMDVFILPSKSEGMPMSIIEAMRQGLYVIATDVGGISEMTDPEYRTLIERTPQAIADSIKDVVINNRITRETRSASRDGYERKLSLKVNIKNYCNLFRSL